MTNYLWIALIGIIIGVVASFLFSGESVKDRFITGAMLSGGGLFLYGLVVSVADVIAHG